MMRDIQIDVAGILKGAAHAVRTYDNALAELGFVQGIDEISYVMDPIAVPFFACEMVRSGYVIHFNGASDHVHTEPHDTCYNVDYQFLSVAMPDVHAFRIEVMGIRSGFSPLHMAKKHEYGPGPHGIHASFKVGDEEEYAAAVHRLREAGWENVQRCNSDYGLFSYWQPYDPASVFPDGPFMFLKPRVNLRDEREAMS